METEVVNTMGDSWAFGAAIIGFAVGIGAGFLLSLLGGGNKRRVQRLESELEQAHAELQGYRARVHDHFAATSELFQDVTERYRTLYDHLAHGARDLCGDTAGEPLPDLPAKALLDNAPRAETATAAGGEDAGTDARAPGETPDATRTAPDETARSSGL